MEQIDLLVQEMQELKENQKKNGGLLKWLSPVISLVVILAGLAVNWGITQNTVENIEKQQTTLQDRTFQNQLDLMSLKSEVLVDRATTSVILTRVVADLETIKTDVKALVDRRP